MIEKKIKLGIVGLGYVGLPLAIEFGKKIQTTGYDINDKRIKNLKNNLDVTLEVESKEFELFLPGHGGPVKSPSDRLTFLINHRLERESQIKEAIKQTPLTSLEITQIVYTDIDNSLIPAATRNVFAHLIDLSERKQVDFHGEISEKTKASLKIK